AKNSLQQVVSFVDARGLLVEDRSNVRVNMTVLTPFSRISPPIPVLTEHVRKGKFYTRKEPIQDFMLDK
ncbi:unnamed protein product, partial [Amoebophrya sp. A120]